MQRNDDARLVLVAGASIAMGEGGGAAEWQSRRRLVFARVPESPSHPRSAQGSSTIMRQVETRCLMAGSVERSKAGSNSTTPRSCGFQRLVPSRFMPVSPQASCTST